MKDTNNIKFNFWLPKELLEDLQKLSKSKGISLSGLIRMLLIEGVKNGK